MKKRGYLSVILIFLVLCAKSQISKLEFGIHSGVNMGSLYGSGTNFYFYNQYKKRFLGVVVGLDFSYRLSKRYSIKTLLQFEQNALILHDLPLKGRSGDVYGQGDEILKLSYLNLPITCNRSFGKKIKLNINGGIFAGFLVRELQITKVKQRFQPPGQPPTDETFKKVTNNYKFLNVGISFGTGVSLPVSNKIKLDINVQDNLGLYDIVKKTNSSRSNTRTNSISFSTGLLISL